MSYPSAVEQEVQEHDIFGGSCGIVWKKKILSEENDRLEVKDHFKMEKGNKTMRRKGVKARVEVSPENLNSTSSEERSGIVSPYSYKDFGGFKNNSLENLKEMERQIEISKQQSRWHQETLGIPVAIVKMHN